MCCLVGMLLATIEAWVPPGMSSLDAFPVVNSS